jgi:hypothetical protein
MMKFRRRIPSKASAFETLMDRVVSDLFPRKGRSRHGGLGVSRRPPTTRRQEYSLEAIEPRLLLSADLTYAAMDPARTTDAVDVGYVAPLVSTNLTLKVETENSVDQSTLDGIVSDASLNTDSRDQLAYSVATQVFFLEINGAADVDYRGPIIVEDIDIPDFVAPGRLAGQEADVLNAMMSVLNGTDFGADVVFTTERPQAGEYSTVYIGGEGSEFAAWGHYLGLAEGVDVGNSNLSDAAFVFSGSISITGLNATQYGAQLALVVAHEAGHLLGAQHDHDDGDGNPLAAVAFDPKVHVSLAGEAADDAVDDGMVTITVDGVDHDYAVHPAIVAALTDWRSYYNAGAVAGDGFPDVLFGQTVIHPIDNGTWLTRVLDMAWAAQDDPSYSVAEKSQILAWSYGFLSHSAGDHFAHSLVNQFAEGVAPGFGAAAASLPGDQRDLGNMLRHLMTEAYIADSLPGFDANKTDRTEVVPGSGDFTDDTTPAIPYSAPIRFIYETFLRAFPDDPTPVVEMKWESGTLIADAGSNTFTRTVGYFGEDIDPIPFTGEHADGFKVGHKITVSGFDNAANNGTFFITDISADGRVITVDAALADETASGDEKIVAYIAKTDPVAAGEIVADASDNTFTRTDGGSFATDGFVEGMLFQALGMTGNYKTYIVKTVTADTITVVGGIGDGVTTFSELVDESAVAGVQLVGLGQRGPALDNIFKLRTAVLEKAVSGD